MAYKVKITRNAINDVYTFYGNVLIAYSNTWNLTDAIYAADKVVDEMLSQIVNGLNGQRAPLLTTLRTIGTAELYTKDRRWYYTVRLKNEEAIIENAVYKSNESNRAYRRGSQNSQANLELDDRRNQRRIGITPTASAFSLPSHLKVLKGVYYGGLKVGYYNHKYIILNSDGTPFIDKWFDKKPKFFKKPFGKYSIIAHVSFCKNLYAISTSGKFYNMNRLWSTMYLEERIRQSLLKHNLLVENNNRHILIKESQLIELISKIVTEMVA